jgi:hypothetical protein
MARYWQGVVPVALGAAALSAVCLVGAHAQSAKQPPAAKAKKQDPSRHSAIEAAGKLLKSGKTEQVVQCSRRPWRAATCRPRSGQGALRARHRLPRAE